MNTNRKLLDEQIEATLDELATAETEEEKSAITKRLETLYNLSLEDEKIGFEETKEKSSNSVFHKFLEGVKTFAPVVVPVVVMLVGCHFEETGSLVSKSFTEARQRTTPKL